MSLSNQMSAQPVQLLLVVPPGPAAFVRAASTPPQTPTKPTATATVAAAAPPGLPFKLKFVFDNPLEVKLRPVVKRRQSSASCYGSSAKAAAAGGDLRRSKARWWWWWFGKWLCLDLD